ncbi:hypothetical protein GCM10010441_04110 [Kitasatospora paracochleata]
MPVATAAGDAAVTSLVAEASANTAPIAEVPVTRPRLRERLSSPDTTPRCSASTSASTAVLLAAWNSAYPAVTATSGPTYPATPNRAGRTASAAQPAALTHSPSTVVRPAPSRSTSRPAGTPLRALTSGPADIASPTAAGASPSARERWNGPTTRVAIITVDTRALITRPAPSAGSRNIPTRTSGAAVRASTRANSATPRPAATSSAALSGPNRPRPSVSASAYAPRVSASSAVPRRSNRARPPAAAGRSAGR